ncbi:MAG: two-component system sensor histidine kinase CreC [Chromatiaceae bacterium]|nr:two-component system sensor histidine kinase CreC [Chromatiaceae bacterium]
MRIPLQVAAGYFLIVGLAGWFVLDVFVEEVKPGVRNTMEDTLVDSANLVAELVAPMIPDSIEASQCAAAISDAFASYARRSVDAPIWEHRKRNLDLQVYVTDAAGRVLCSTDPDEVGRDYSRWNDVRRTLVGGYGARSTRAIAGDSSTSVMHVAAPVTDGERIIGVVSVGKAGNSVAPIIADSEAKIRQRGFLLLLIAALIGALFTWHLTRAIARLRRYARDVSEGRRVPPPRSGARELAELAEALGAMRERLEGKQYVERYLHALTHELKSPLAAIGGAAELLGEADMPETERRRFLCNIREQADRLGRVADRLLDLARLEQRQVLGATESIDLVPLARTLVEVSGPMAAQREIRVGLQGEAVLRVQGDRFLLSQAIGNLLDNALDFSPDGGHVEIEVSRTDDAAEISIRDRGTGIPDYAADRVFERFFSLPRPGGSRKGTGLGLSFVREVAELHGGSVQLVNLCPGDHPEGVRATLRLPLAQ